MLKFEEKDGVITVKKEDLEMYEKQTKEDAKIADKVRTLSTDFDYEGNELDFLDDAVELATTKVAQMGDEDMGKGKGKGKGDDEDEDEDEGKDKDKKGRHGPTALQIPDELNTKIDQAAAMSLAATRETHFITFKQDRPELVKKEGLKGKLDKEIGSLIQENPSLLKGGNWYDKAVRSLSLKDGTFYEEIKEEVQKHEQDRLANVDALTGVGAAEGTKADGKTPKLIDEVRAAVAPETVEGKKE